MTDGAYFSCGVPDACPKGGEHQWDGPGREWQDACICCFGEGKRIDAEGTVTEEVCRKCKGTGNGCTTDTATCSKCDADAFSHSLWNGP